LNECRTIGGDPPVQAWLIGFDLILPLLLLQFCFIQKKKQETNTITGRSPPWPPTTVPLGEPNRLRAA
jgi:hypothetical protein